MRAPNITTIDRLNEIESASLYKRERVIASAQQAHIHLAIIAAASSL